MAIFHSNIQIISRGKGKSAVAAAAYRAGEIIKNEYDGITHDYTRKGGVVHTEILIPDHAPHKYADRAVLWNAVEKVEKAVNSQLAREIDIALPVELTREQNIALIRDYVEKTFVSAGMCADLCVHDTGNGNPHAHIMLTMRPIDENGKWGGKQKKEYVLDRDGNKIYDQKKRQYKCRSIPTTDWNEQSRADEWRKAWEDAANAELKLRGFDARIDHRSYAEQGVEKIPTVHMGVTASQLESRGIITERGNQNREIEAANRELRMLRARIVKLEKWIVEESVNTAPPTLSDVITDILDRRGQSAVSRLQAASQVLLFLQQNKVYDIADLEEKVKSMYGKVQTIRTNLKKVERRIGTLKEHIMHSENFKNYRKLKRQYDELYSEYTTARKATGFGAERKAQKALETANNFYESNRAGLTLFGSSERYLRDVLQERFDPKKLPPITKWHNDLANKTAEKDALHQDYYSLKDETAKVEKIQASVKEILHSDSPK